MDNRKWKLNLKIETENRNWKLKLEIEIEIDKLIEIQFLSLQRWEYLGRTECLQNIESIGF